MVKSKGKHVMMDAFPRCFSKEPLSGAPPGIQITDALSWLYSNFSEKRAPETGDVSLAFTGGYLFERARWLTGTPLHSEGAFTHVVLFDKSDFTPITKNVRLPIECRRKTPREEAVEVWEAELRPVKESALERRRSMPPEERFQFLSEDLPLPAPWASVMEDRDDMRRWVIGDVVLSLLDRSGPHHLKHRVMGDLKGKRALFDGHCLSWGDVCGLEGFCGYEVLPGRPGGERSFEDAVPLSAEEAARTPLAVEYVSSSERIVYFAPRFRNELGESDFTAFWYASDPGALWATDDGTVQINSCDVDLVYLALSFDAKKRDAGGGGRVCIRTGHPCAWAPTPWAKSDRVSPSRPGNSYKKDCYIDVPALGACALDLVRGTGWSPESGLQSAALAFACCMVSAGSDYTEGFEGVSHASFFAALKNNARYVGELVSVDPCVVGGVSLDGEAFYRLVKAAYCERYSSTRVSFRDFNYSNVATADVRRMVEETNARYPEKQMPGAVSLMGRLGNLWYYAIMMAQVGEWKLRLPRGEELRLYGYGTELRADGGAPLPGTISKKNIRRVCNDHILALKARKAATEERKPRAKKGVTACEFPPHLGEFD